MSSNPWNKQPQDQEYNSFYAGYIGQVEQIDVQQFLIAQLDQILDMFAHIDETKGDYAYAPDKWTIKDVMRHIIDTEWIFTYRALRFARGDSTPLPGMDQDLFMAGVDTSSDSLDSLVKEFKYLRLATLTLIERFSTLDLDKTGTASGFPISVRALIFIIAGHAQHHIKVIQERYI